MFKGLVETQSTSLPITSANHSTDTSILVQIHPTNPTPLYVQTPLSPTIVLGYLAESAAEIHQVEMREHLSTANPMSRRFGRETPTGRVSISRGFTYFLN